MRSRARHLTAHITLEIKQVLHLFPLFWFHPVDAAAELFQLICFFCRGRLFPHTQGYKYLFVLYTVCAVSCKEMD